ncbi:YigZ family protein [Tissierella sp. MSJ-40]|uniref:YigZ family protein n=1 Tax=Tissierella simiarum TaxID=2841534 RepID=A0ABS6E5M4_9FIRM|nr:YigZ family protein [Tissierella simiarum]MBU5438217.1 YigZ family protein [Tissierella simiarum]
MNNVYRTIHNYGEEEVIINKSRFIGYAMPINNEEEALAFIDKIKTKHRDATHNVYAYVVGDNNNIQRFNDDGEPSGTAGIPVLEVIKKEDLRNVVVVVTRYFGGIKLGTGGLIRAYTKGAKIGLDAGIIVERILHTKIKIRVDYTLYGKIENYLMTNGYLVDDVIFDDGVNIFVYIKFSEVESFNKTIIDLCSGNVMMEEILEEYLTIKDGERLL